MKNLIYPLLLFLLLISCGQNDLEKEALEYTEKELAPDEKDSNDEEAESLAPVVEVSYTHHSPCLFEVSLPSTMKLEAMYDDVSSDYCDYHVKGKPGDLFLEFHSLLNSRYEYDNIKDLYEIALKTTKLDINYKAQKGNWFVISGTNKSNGNTVYWKRVWGEMYVSDLHIEYPKSKASEIEPSIGTISNSFKSR